MVGNKQKVNTPQLIKPIEAEESEVGTKWVKGEEKLRNAKEKKRNEQVMGTKEGPRTIDSRERNMMIWMFYQSGRVV
jgi:hypothetical protein